MGAGFRGIPATVVGGWARKASDTGAAGVAVAWKVNAGPATPGAAATTVTGPATWPSVNAVWARPCESVTALAGRIVPEPVATEKDTVTPLRGAPLESVTFTTS